MSQKLEFLKYTQVQGEKYLGIATIRYEKRFILRFKIQASEKGGFYAQPASHKIVEFGKDTYVPAFQIDSQYEADEIKTFVLGNVQQYLSQQPQPQQIFGQTQPQQQQQYQSHSPNQPFYKPPVQVQQNAYGQASIPQQQSIFNEGVPF
jgi:hypothetical protein